MEITEVKVFPVNEEKLKAFVSVVFDSCFMVNDIKIIRGRDGLFISMPSRKKKNGEFKDVAHPLNNETRRAIETEVLGEYERVLEERGEPTPKARRPVRSEPVAAKPAPAPAPTPAPAPVVDLPAASPPMVEPPRAAAAIEPPAAAASPPMAADGGEDQTLEQVEEMHLRDSFWTVT